MKRSHDGVAVSQKGRSLFRCAWLLALLIGLVGLAAPAAAQPIPPGQPCVVTKLGWWESPDLAPFFIDPDGPSPTSDCDFQLWAWSAFVHYMHRDPNPNNGGVPLFLNLPTYTDLKPDQPPITLLQAKALVHPRTLNLIPRDNQPQTLGSFQQAGPKGVLVDQNGRSVYYISHMDPIYFTFSQTYFGPKSYQNASPTLNYPIAATVLKTSWRLLQPGDDFSKIFTTTATIPLLENDGKGHLQLSGKMQENVPVALVGVHVVGVIKDHPEFVWATFEHIGNAPFLPSGMDPHSPNPVSAQNFTFYKGGTPANASNFLPKNESIDAATQVITPITNVFQEFSYGGATPDRVTDIEQANAHFQSKIPPANIDPRFANYRMTGSVWQLPNTLVPGDGSLDETAIGSISLDNATMETFVQGEGTNCFTCHNTVGGGAKFAAKNINTSHIMTSVFRVPEAVLQARGAGAAAKTLVPAPGPRP
jgi:hypothetical protein